MEGEIMAKDDGSTSFKLLAAFFSGQSRALGGAFGPAPQSRVSDAAGDDLHYALNCTGRLYNLTSRSSFAAAEVQQ